MVVLNLCLVPWSFFIPQTNHHIFQSQPLRPWHLRALVRPWHQGLPSARRCSCFLLFGAERRRRQLSRQFLLVFWAKCLDAAARLHLNCHLTSRKIHKSSMKWNKRVVPSSYMVLHQLSKLNIYVICSFIFLLHQRTPCLPPSAAADAILRALGNGATSCHRSELETGFHPQATLA